MILRAVPAARQGRRLRRHRAELRPRQRPLARSRARRSSQAIRKMADKIGIAISGLCSFLFWPYPLTSNDPAKRSRGLELAGKMAQAAHDLGTENLLVVPGAVHIPWRDRPRAGAERRLRPPRPRGGRASWCRTAEKLKVSPQHREHLLQRLPDDADGDERLRRQLRRASTCRSTSTPATSCCSSSPSTGSRSSASGSRTSTSRSSRRRGPTIRWSRSARCSTARPTGRR